MEFNNTLKILYSVFFVLLIVLLILPLPILATHRYILFALEICLLLGLRLSLQNIVVYVSAIELSWIVFGMMGLCSYAWAINGSLIWFSLAIWVGLILYLLLLKDILVLDKAKIFISRIFATLFLISLVYVAVVYFYQLPGTKYFGYNNNYVTLQLLSLWPFLLYHANKHVLFSLLKWLSSIALAYILYNSYSKGSQLIFIFLAFLIVCDILYHLSKIRRAYAILSILIISAVLFFLGVKYLKMDTLVERMIDASDFSRLYMLKDSLNIVMQRPLLGIGLGNWHNWAYSKDLTGYLGLLNNSFYRVNSHNIYGLILAESGFVGLVCYLVGICVPIYKKIKQYPRLIFLDKACLLSLVIYLLGTLFYLSSYSYEGFFSGVQLVAFCALAILSYDATSRAIFEFNIKWLSLIIAFPLVWFLYYYHIDSKFRKTLEDETLSPKEANSLLQSIYHPIFTTTHGYYPDGVNLSLDLKIASNYLEMDSLDQADAYFQRGLAILPNDDYLLLEYANFLSCHKRAFTKAKSYLKKIHIKQQAHIKVNRLLAYIAMEENNYDLARHYMSARYIDRSNEGIRLLELQLYLSEYKNNLLHLTSEQKEVIAERLSPIKKNIPVYFTASCQINKTTKEVNTLNSKIGQFSHEMDTTFLSILNKEQFFIYLNDISSRLIGYQLWILNYLCKLNETQLLSIEAMMKEQFTSQKYIQLKMSLPNTTSVEKKEYQAELEDIASYMDNKLRDILNKNQYQAYINYNSNKWLMQSRN